MGENDDKFGVATLALKMTQDDLNLCGAAPAASQLSRGNA
jgi:hypothetical protein